jgi:hypothetical protein
MEKPQDDSLKEDKVRVCFIYSFQMSGEEEEVVLQENSIHITMNVGKYKEYCKRVTHFFLLHYFTSSHY